MKKITAHYIAKNNNNSISVEMKKNSDPVYINPCDVISVDGNFATIKRAEDYPELFETEPAVSSIWEKLSQDDVEESLRIASYPAERAGQGPSKSQISLLAELMFKSGDNRVMDMPNIITKKQAANQISSYIKENKNV